MQADDVNGVDIELRDLRLPLVTSQHRSLRKAAEARNIRQPTLSRRLHEIEYQLGVAGLGSGRCHAIPDNSHAINIFRACCKPKRPHRKKAAYQPRFFKARSGPRGRFQSSFSWRVSLARHPHCWGQGSVQNLDMGTWLLTWVEAQVTPAKSGQGREWRQARRLGDRHRIDSVHTEALRRRGGRKQYRSPPAGDP
jgi:hypothetical protein